MIFMNNNNEIHYSVWKNKIEVHFKKYCNFCNWHTVCWQVEISGEGFTGPEEVAERRKRQTGGTLGNIQRTTTGKLCTSGVHKYKIFTNRVNICNILSSVLVF